MRNKNKILISMAMGVIANLPSNVNAQTYYSCIPQGCPAGQYFDGKSCLDLPKLTACPSGQYFDGANCLPYSNLLCSAEYVWSEKSSKCLTKTCTYKFEAFSITSADSGVSYTKGSFAGKCPDHRDCYNYTAILPRGKCINYTKGDGNGGYIHCCDW